MQSSHFDETGRARMMDISEKKDTLRTAVARGKVSLKKETVQLIREGLIGKGDVLAVAQVAGIMASKNTSGIIPMCHNILLNSVEIKYDIKENEIEIEGRVKAFGKTGVEMEALTCVSAAALTIYDMCKSVDRDMIISNIMLIYKTGGKSGDYVR